MNHLRCKIKGEIRTGKILIQLCAVLSLFLCACSDRPVPAENHVVMSLGKKITTIDPALAADFPSQSVAGAIYDTLIQYEYGSPVYRTEPAMLAEPPEIQEDGKTYTFRLRDDLYFHESPVFITETQRKVTSRDVVFSLLRLADARLNSPGYWVVRDTIEGIQDFRKRSTSATDFTCYDILPSGIQIIDERTFRIRTTHAGTRLPYLLAMPYCGIVSRHAAEQSQLAGSGPYRLERWNKDHSLELVRYKGFRTEYFKNAPLAEDRQKRLPFADRITCYLVRQNVSSWLMFLQGELDYYALENDQFQGIVQKGGTISEALTERGIRLKQAPQLETNYIGFHFGDPVLGKNPDLRKAISLAFDKDMRVMQSGGRFVPANGAVPPGIAGSLPDGGAYGKRNIALAKEYLVKAGYPGGIDPATGRPLVISFDQAGTDTLFQQQAEMMANDLREIGLDVRTNLNTRPRFQSKLAAGDVQMFRYSWVADYPDAENFLQLFYSGNAGGCNRACYRDPVYDKMYEEVQFQADPEAYRKMGRYLQEQCPWIFETHVQGFTLHHQWLKHYELHDFAFNRWKYLSASAQEREAARSKFTPLSMSALR